MIRRLAGAAVAAVAAVAALATPVWAHGLGGRVDLPVPRWLFVFGAATVLVVSFVLLGVLWREPRFPRAAPSGRDSILQDFLRSHVAEWTVRVVGLAWFLVVTVAALLPGRADATIAPVAILIWFWVGLAFLQALCGDWWRTLSPFDTLGRLLGLDAGPPPPRPYPLALGNWPAAIGLFAFTWVELVDPFGSRPGSLGVLVVLYAAVQIAGMARFGREAWIANAETFSVYLGLIARIAPLRRDPQGRVVVRAPLARLPEVEPRPGMLALVLVALGTTTFDGFSRTSFWLARTALLEGGARVAAGTAGLLVAVLVVGGAYALAMRGAAGADGGRWHMLAIRFAHTLVPIVVAYLVAHYFSYLLIEGQIGIARISDPFGRGWDLFGTAQRTIRLEIVSAQFVWYVQVAAIVVGHVAGVVLAHDLALRLSPDGALRTQYALLAVMVAFTAGGLLILSA